MAQNIMAATSALPAVLVSAAVTASEATYYTCPGSSAVKISSATVCNVTGTARVISVSVVQSGDSAGSSNRVCSFELAAGDSAVLSEMINVFLGPGDFISAVAAVA